MGVEKKRSTLSVLFYIKRQKLLKNGEAPICMRITADKRKAEIMIKRSVPAALWNQAKECSKGKDRNSTELNHYINAVRTKILQIHRELETEGCIVTADAIRDRYYGRDNIQRTLLEVYADCIRVDDAVRDSRFIRGVFMRYSQSDSFHLQEQGTE